MVIFCDIQRKLGINAFMGTDQPVILITYPDLGRCCLQDCRLSTMSVEYGIVVAVILDVVVVRDFQDCFIIADHIASAWQWFHTWSVVFLKCILPGILFLLKRSWIEGCYYSFDLSIQIAQWGIDLFLEFFHQMCFKVSDMFFNRCLVLIISNYR